MDKKIAKNGKRYCIDEKINRRIHRDRMRTKTGILIFLSVFMTGVVLLLLFFVSSNFYFITILSL